MSDTFTSCIQRSMQHLADRFEFAVADEFETTEAAEVLYTNKTTGLRVRLDWREFRPFFTLYRLKNGCLPKEDRGLRDPCVQGNVFDADHLLLRRGGTSTPAGAMFASRDQSAVDRTLTRYVAALERYAGDVLGGDFTIFADLDETVKANRATLLDPSP